MHTEARSAIPKNLPCSIHGTSIELNGQGALIIGQSGSGKSSLALQLMAFGAGLISDDLTWLEPQKNAIELSRPVTAPKRVQIEARGLGLLDAIPSDPAPLAVIVDLSQTETQRLPEPKVLKIAEFEVRCVHKVDNPSFPAMVLQYLMPK